MFQLLAIESDSEIVYSQKYLDFIVDQVNSPIYGVYYPNCIDKQTKDRSSAANFISRILLTHGMIRSPQVQIRILLQELVTSGWVWYKKFDMDDLIPGDVVVWEKDKSGHQHIGFVHENNFAVSFYGKKKFPILHELEFRDLWHGNNRKIISRFTFQGKK